MNELTRSQKIISWILQILAAGIFLQTLFFKFTGAPESIYIFKTVGMEPWGRIGSGVVELIASILLLTSKRAWLGAFLGLGAITGAIFFHLTTLGINVQGDGGTLFYLALTIFISCLSVLVIRRKQAIKDVQNWLLKNKV